MGGTLTPGRGQLTTTSGRDPTTTTMVGAHPRRISLPPWARPAEQLDSMVGGRMDAEANILLVEESYDLQLRI